MSHIVDFYELTYVYSIFLFNTYFYKTKANSQIYRKQTLEEYTYIPWNEQKQVPTTITHRGAIKKYKINQFIAMRYVRVLSAVFLLFHFSKNKLKSDKKCDCTTFRGNFYILHAGLYIFITSFFITDCNCFFFY